MGKTYRINDIFYSLQGEGRHTGRAAVFIRFSGCNLRCPFCDTDFDSSRLMTADEIIDAIAPWMHCGFVVLTGGEPSLQVDTELVDKLHEAGLFIAMETNGTHAIAQDQFRRPSSAHCHSSGRRGESGFRRHPSS